MYTKRFWDPEYLLNLKLKKKKKKNNCQNRVGIIHFVLCNAAGLYSVICIFQAIIFTYELIV